MKTHKMLIIALVLSVSMGCEDDFLDRPDLDNISAENFWQTPEDLELYATQFYLSLPGWQPGGWNGGIYWEDDNSDNIIHNNVATSGTILGDNIPTTGNNNWDFGAIRSMNIFMENYENVEAAFDDIKHYVGEVLFFRALAHFNLVRNYGDVPWLDKSLLPDSEELQGERMARNVVIDNIMADLDNAIAYLVSGRNSGGNRLNRECASLLKARVALYEGTWEKYHAGTAYGVSGSDGSQYLQIAADVAKALIDDPGGFAIYTTGDPSTDYTMLFNQADYSANPEVMLWRQFNLNEGVTHNGQRYLPRIGGGRGLTKALVDSYLLTDGLPIAASPLYQGDQSLTEVAANRDLRLSQTMWLPGQLMQTGRGAPDIFFERASLEDGGAAGCPTGYMIRKGANTDRELSHTGGVGTTSSPIFRFAEALLIYAEAKAEMGTITQNDVDMTINVIRDRAGMPGLVINNIFNDPDWQFPSLSPIINEVRRERRIELAAEGYRFDDLMRWRAHETFIGARFKGAFFVQSDYPGLEEGVSVFLDNDGYIDPHQTQIPSGLAFDPNRDYLLPIPLDEITLNSNLTQNPGW